MLGPRESEYRLCDLFAPLAIITLKSGYKLSDSTHVNARHVADCLNELNEKNDSAQSSLGKVTATGSLDVKGSAVVGLDSTTGGDGESGRPTHVTDAFLAERVFVMSLKDAYGNFVFVGPYVIKEFDADKIIELKPNPYTEGLKNKKVDIGFREYLLFDVGN